MQAYRLPSEDEQPSPSTLQRFLRCLGFMIRVCCCINQEEELSLGDSSRANLLESRGQESHIEAALSPLSPPRAPELDHRSPRKGEPPSSSSLNSWQRLQQIAQSGRQQRLGTPGGGGEAAGEGVGTGAATAAAAGGVIEKEGREDVPLLDDDICPICLDPYTDENPRLATACAHHYHLQCALSWFERGSQTCPMCGSEMGLDDVL